MQQRRPDCILDALKCKGLAGALVLQHNGQRNLALALAEKLKRQYRVVPGGLLRTGQYPIRTVRIARRYLHRGGAALYRDTFHTVVCKGRVHALCVEEQRFLAAGRCILCKCCHLCGLLCPIKTSKTGGSLLHQLALPIAPVGGDAQNTLHPDGNTANRAGTECTDTGKLTVHLKRQRSVALTVSLNFHHCIVLDDGRGHSRRTAGHAPFCIGQRLPQLVLRHELHRCRFAHIAVNILDVRGNGDLCRDR